MAESFTDFFTLPGMVAYFLGIASASLWHYWKLRLSGKRHVINWTTLGLIIGVSSMVFVGIQNTRLATEVQDCQREFNNTLMARALIYDVNDRLSQEQRHWLGKSDEAVGDLIRLSTMPTDPDIAALPRNDPRRVAWDAGLVTSYNLRTARYRAEIVRIEKEQDANEAMRKAHPLPQPTCGVVP